MLLARWSVSSGVHDSKSIRMTFVVVSAPGSTELRELPWRETRAEQRIGLASMLQIYIDIPAHPPSAACPPPAATKSHECEAAPDVA
jgi:hypothetical protein